MKVAKLDYYGGFRTKTFGEIFDSADSFVEAAKNCGIPSLLKDTTLTTLFYLLYAEYGNSHIANAMSEDQFVYKVFSTVFMYGPTWEKNLDIQAKLRALSLDSGSEIYKGGKAVYNHSYNPSSAPSSNTLEELPTINEQNVTGYKKSVLDGLEMLSALLERDVTKEFIDKFKRLFLIIVAPDYPLLYKTTDENEIEI